MTAREMLINVAESLERTPGPFDLTRAAALRILADRLDAEMATASAAMEECSRRGFHDVLSQWIATILARLDAPLDVDPSSNSKIIGCTFDDKAPTGILVDGDAISTARLDAPHDGDGHHVPIGAVHLSCGTAMQLNTRFRDGGERWYCPKCHEYLDAPPGEPKT